jgi:sulfur-carrier protein adenylyltransferase/sulfurtransferase
MLTTLPNLSPSELSRYSRHILLDEIGVEGQQRLAAARVLVIGAGGLGSPAALYLAAAGVGTLGIADLDVVEEHNLQRQLLHDTTTLGAEKVESASRRLDAINPHIQVVKHSQGITRENAAGIFRSYDVIVDGTDNFTARYVNNDAAFVAGKPLVFGSVFKFEGQVSVFDPAREGPCYRCLFPHPPPSGSVPGCGEAGVLGALCGVIGSLQALETIKLILNLGESLRGRLLTYDALHQRFSTLNLKPSPTCQLCGSTASDSTSNKAPDRAVEETNPNPQMNALQVSAVEAKQLWDRDPNGVAIIDVRESWEREICRVEGSEHIPMREIPENLSRLRKDQHLLILCHHGARSLNVTNYLRSQGFEAVTNISGGIAAWAATIDSTMPRY